MKPSSPYASPTPLPALPMGKNQFEDFQPEQWLDAVEAAAQLRVSKSAICEYIKSGKLRASFLGRRYLISREAISEFVAGRQRRLKK